MTKENNKKEVNGMSDKTKEENDLYNAKSSLEKAIENILESNELTVEEKCNSAVHFSNALENLKRAAEAMAGE